MTIATRPCASESSTAPVGTPVMTRRDWSREEIQALFARPFMDLVFAAQSVHRRHSDPNAVQVSTLLSIKTGACPEDCAYCPQSKRFDAGRPLLGGLTPPAASARRGQRLR